MTVLSLFDGISCARVALDRLGRKDVFYLASEIDKYASAITRHQWPDTIHLGDITHIRREDLPEQIDLLIGGSPCQDLSIAKVGRKGLDGDRSGLFWQWVRLWRECTPRYWVLENVSSMPKEARQIISETLGVEPIMINAALVSAQNRKRLFWTNIQTDMFGNCHIPQPEDRGILLKHILESGIVYKRDGISTDKSYCLDSNYWKNENIKHHEKHHKRQLIAEPKQQNEIKAPTLTTAYGRQGSSKEYMSMQNAVAAAMRSRTPINDSIGKKYEIRQLTPVECERLMTLSDGYTSTGDFGDGIPKQISKTQRYKTLGNGFVVDVVAHILGFMDIESRGSLATN